MGSTYSKLDRFDSAQDSNTTRETATLVEKRYLASFSPLQTKNQLAALSDADVMWMFKSSSSVIFYTHNPRYLADQELDTRELEARNRATEEVYTELFQSFVQTRNFSKARDLKIAHPADKMEDLPEILEADHAKAPSVLAIDSHRHALEHRHASIDPKFQIIVIAHPLCHFTRNAVTDIEKDAVLRSIFAEHAIWLAPQNRNLDFDVFRRWNEAYPHEAMVIAYQESQWPLLDDWATPIFYFLKSGKLVDKVVGWKSSAEGLSALREALLAAGRTTSQAVE